MILKKMKFELKLFEKRAIIAYHIPPGTNSYDVIPLWHAKYVIQYDSIVAKVLNFFFFY